MAKSIDECFDDLFMAETGYWCLESDYILYVFQTAPSQNKATSILDRDKNGLLRKMEKFDSKKLKHPGLEDCYQRFYEGKIGVDDLLTGYTQRIFCRLHNKKTTAEFLGINRNTIARRLREYFKGEYTYNTSVIREIAGKINDLNLDQLRKMYVSFTLDETEDNINETSRRTGVDKVTIRKILKDKTPYKDHALVFEKCNKRRITFPEMEKWYVVALAAESAKKLGISPGSFKTKVAEYVNDDFSKL